MSGLADIKFRTSYRKGEQDIGEEFYLPCMAVASRYDRAVGFFNSAIYTIAWPSLRAFVQRGAQMRLVCSPVLSSNDIDAIEKGYSEKFESDNAARLKADITRMLATPYLHKPTTVLATLVGLGVVEIRVAFMGTGLQNPGHRRLFHDKLGLFRDAESNTVAFKGSMNETYAGLSSDGNLESIDVFLSWEHEREAGRVHNDQDYFDRLWENEYRFEGLTVKAFPEIAHSELINAADKERWPDLVDEICREIDAARQYENRSATGRKTLRPHQANALAEWEKKGRRGIFEHATGSGKTFTALSAIRRCIKDGLVPLVLVPSEDLLKQWYREIASTLGDLSPQVLRCGAGYTRWRDDHLLGPWTRPDNTDRLVLATTQTASSPDFFAEVRKGQHLFVVCDEVHRVGSPRQQILLTMDSGPRLGLSATPRRSGDPLGTQRIFDYFEGLVPPPFTLADAIASNALTPYMYHVHCTYLDSGEQDAWNELTKKIQRLTAQNASAKNPVPGISDQVKRLLIDRARILKQASAKSPLAAEVVERFYQRGQRWIVYCDDLDQLSAVEAALSARGVDSIVYHSQMEGDRSETLRLFEINGGIVVSIRCLDEGVDIPSVTHALILASSRNPREFIQRRGRVLRVAPGKNVAHIHDLLILPMTTTETGEQEDPKTNIVAAELARAQEFGRSALNPAVITDIERIALRYSTDYRALLDVGYEEDDE